MKVIEQLFFNNWRDDQQYERTGCTINDTTQHCKKCSWKHQWDMCMLEEELKRGATLISIKRCLC